MKVKVEIKHDESSNRKMIVITDTEHVHKVWKFFDPDQGIGWPQTMSVQTLILIEHIINTIMSE